MRSLIVFVLLVAMLAALGAIVAGRDRTPHISHPPRPRVVAQPVRDAGVTGSSADGGASRGDGGVRAARVLDRPLRVIALGWESLAPGLLANRGLTPGADSAFNAAGLELHLAVASDGSALEGALARGGADARGADVAIMPLPVFVASYERLRALAPEVFLVTGWSRGREGLAGRQPLTSSAFAGGREVTLSGLPGTATAFVGLAALELSGLPPSRVRLVSADVTEERFATFSSVDRVTAGTREPGSRRLLLTTADATRLVPLVAVAPHGFVTAHGAALAVWAREWLSGMRRLREDVPAAARQVAGTPGAPEAVELLERLGMLEPSPLADNARAMGLSGRGAVTLDRLFQQCWRLWRGAGVLSTPAPEAVPLSTATVVSLVRADSSMTQAPRLQPATGTVGSGAPPRGATVLLAREVEGRVDEATLAQDVAVLAGTFESALVRLTVRGDPQRATRALTSARDRFGLVSERLFVGRASVAPRVSALIEVLVVP